ncbi:MAG: LamG domain-containing protein, partial [Candidatus Thorarchaeota archaeon]|nr:LamG domain-containing protein [Candidatus Thorarchaeota archaeon]
TRDTTITMAYGNPNAPSSSSTSIWDDYATVQHLGDDPSGTVYDSTSNNYDGTSYGSQGSEDSITGLIGNSIDFDDEENDQIGIGQVYTDDWDQVTISIWVKMDESYDCRVFSKAHGSDPSTHMITIRIASNGMTARISTDGGGGASYNGNTTLNLGSWNLLTWTWSASSGRLLGYMNGTPVIDSLHGGTSITDSIDVFTIGNTDLTTAKYFDGALDEARLTNRVLSQAWITTEFNNQINPDSFISVGSERTLQSIWTDESSAQIVLTTGSPAPISTDIMFTMDIAGSGQSLDSGLNPGSSFYMVNGSDVVDWTAGVLVSPPASTAAMDVLIEYPMTEWNPIAVSNPIGENKTYGTEWDFQGGNVYIYEEAFDYWGVWTLYFESWNYVENLQLGLNGQALGNTATFDINDNAEFEVTSPWIENAIVGLRLTDPTGTIWHTDDKTTGTPGTTWDIPSFQYRMQLTIPSAQVDADVDNFPMAVDFFDTDFQTKVQADGDDLVFVQNGLVLSHEIERFDGTGRLVAWVKANLSSTVDTTMWLYYGNPVVGSTESPGDLWSNGYEAVWHLAEDVQNEASGEPHYDSTFNNYTGTHNGNSVASGVLTGSTATNFDGNDWIVVDENEGLNPAGDLTLSGWFYIGSAWS